MNSDSLPETLAILGPGVLGGSLALCWAERFPRRGLLLWGRSESSLSAAREVLRDECLTTDLAEVVSKADLIVLATPVGVMKSLVVQLLALGLKEGSLLTDVGSVKAMVHRGIEELLSERGIDFVGSHPMAGSEKVGFSAARSDLFKGAACILTGDNSALDKVRAFWEQVGCRCSTMNPDQHDSAIARISHMPHVMASATSIAALADDPSLGELAGGGLRDTTRVASGDVDLWTEILLENSKALVTPLQAVAKELREVLAILEANDQESLKLWLTSAKHLRDGLNR